MKNLTFYVQPICSYGAKAVVMTSAIVNRIAENLLPTMEDAFVTFCFEGEEPLQVSTEFYEYFVSEMEQHKTKNVQLSYCVKTDGKLIDEERCAFFARHNYSVGIYFNGAKRLHNSSKTVQPYLATHKTVLSAVELLKEANVAVYPVCYVSEITTTQKTNVLQYFMKQGFEKVEFVFIHALLESSRKEGFALSPDSYYTFIRKLTETYLAAKEKGKKIEVAFLDDFLRLSQRQEPICCGNFGYCEGNFTFVADGNLYPCNKAECNSLGHVKDIDFEALYLNKEYVEFVKSSYVQEGSCLVCPVYDVCKGGCLSERMHDGQVGLNVFCEGRKKLFSYLIDKLQVHTEDDA